MDDEHDKRRIRPARVDLDVLLHRMTPETFPDAIDFGAPVGGEVEGDRRNASREGPYS